MRWVKSLATIVLMGVPAWVMLGGFLRSGATSVVVLVQDPEVEVRVDDQVVRPGVDSRTFGPIDVAPGEHRVQVLDDGRTLFDQVVQAGVGGPVEVKARWSTRAAAGDALIPGLELEAKNHAGHQARVTAVGPVGDGRTVLSTGADGTLRTWDTSTGAEVRSVAAHEGVVQGMTVLADGRRAVTVGDDQILRVWEVATGRELQAIPTDFHAILTCTTAAPDGRTVAIGGADGTILLIDLESGRRRTSWNVPRAIPAALAFSPDGRTLLAGLKSVPARESTVNVYDLESGRLLRELRGHRGPVWSVVFLPDGRRALSGGGDRSLRLWNVADGTLLKTFEGHPGSVMSVAVSRDGRYALAGTGHYWVGGWADAESYGTHLWDLVEGQALGCLETSGPVRAVAFTSDGRRVLSGGEDRVVRLWSLPDPATLVRRAPAEAATVSRIPTAEPGKG